MAKERDNFKAGLFVLSGLVLALVVIFVLADFESLVARRQTVKVFYHLADGLQGLKEGASVTLGDQPIGAVAVIGDQTEPNSDRVIGKIVEIEIPQRYRLAQDAVIELVVPPLGSGTRLNIRSVGQGAPYRGETPIPGSVAGSALTKSLVRDVGIEETQRQQIRNIIGNIEALTTSLKTDVPEVLAAAKRVMAHIEPLTATARLAVDDVRGIVGQVRTRSEPWFDRIDSITEKTDQSLTTVRDVLRDKDPAIRGAVDNVHQITQTVREKTLAQVTEALDRAGQAMENVRVATAELRTIVVGQRPVLERAMANAQIMSEQLKLTAIEVRRSPWRLLYKPGDKELDTDNLYDAARSYALAASTLDAAAQSLRAVAQKQPEERERIGQLLEHLEKIFGQYQKAEKEFWEALDGRTPAGGTGK